MVEGHVLLRLRHLRPQPVGGMERSGKWHRGEEWGQTGGGGGGGSGGGGSSSGGFSVPPEEGGGGGFQELPPPRTAPPRQRKLQKEEEEEASPDCEDAAGGGGGDPLPSPSPPGHPAPERTDQGAGHGGPCVHGGGN